MMEHCPAMERVIAAFEDGAKSAESRSRTDEDCPFGDAEPGLREYWLDGFYSIRSAALSEPEKKFA